MRPERLGNPLAVRTVVVVYPDIGEPYRGVFAQIINGVEAQSQKPVVSIAVDGNGHAQELPDELRRLQVHAVIALGRSGLKAASAIDKSHKVVVGGVLSVPEAEAQDFAVHSLSPDPRHPAREHQRGVGAQAVHREYCASASGTDSTPPTSLCATLSIAERRLQPAAPDGGTWTCSRTARPAARAWPFRTAMLTTGLRLGLDAVDDLSKTPR